MKKIFRKIHLWLSVPFGIFITLICFSGAMLVFEKEITEWCRPDLYFVKEVKEKPLPIDSLMRRVASTLPDSVTVTGVTISPDAERTWQVSLSKPRRASLYVNPYTGEVTGRNGRLPFYDTMFHLHRWMLGSSTGFGKLLVGISTLMLVFILVTGILMWLTNRKKPLGKSLAISFTKGWPRFWHDLHVAGGIYATIFLLAIALTGLTWSFPWYRTAFYGMFGVEASADGHGGGRGEGHRLRPESNRHEHGEAHTRHDSIRGVEADGHRHGHRHVEGVQPHRCHTSEGSDKSIPAQDIPSNSTVKAESDNGIQSASTETAEQPYDRERRGGDHRGRHEGHGGRGRYHHDGDSTRRHNGHHRGDSLLSLTENQITAAEVERADYQRHRTQIVGDTSVSSHRRDGKGRRSDKAQKEVSAGRHAGNAEMSHGNIRTKQEDSVAITELPQLLPFVHWQDVYERLAAAHPGYRQITISDGSASVVPAGRNSLRSGDRFDFDAASGTITGSTPYAEQDKSAHVRSAVYTVHVGSWGGLLTRIVTFFAALLGATLPLTGYYLWIRRLRNKTTHKHPKQ